MKLLKQKHSREILEMDQQYNDLRKNNQAIIDDLRRQLADKDILIKQLYEKIEMLENQNKKYSELQGILVSRDFLIAQLREQLEKCNKERNILTQQIEKLSKDHAELFIVKDRQIQQYLQQIEQKNYKINELMN